MRISSTRPDVGGPGSARLRQRDDVGPARRAGLMKRFAVWVFYAIGALAILYLAHYAYAAFTGNRLQPGDPIHIFRKPDAPDYS
jgi:hypothetical protein